MSAPDTIDGPPVGVALEDVPDVEAPTLRRGMTQPRMAIGSSDRDPVAQTEPWHVTPTDIAASEWGLSVTAAATEARKAAADALAEAKRARRRWGWLIAVGGILSALIAPVTVFTVKKLLAVERQAGIDQEREAIRVDDHRLLHQLRDRMSEMRGELRALNPVGAVRLQGPPREPEPQDDPP